MDHAVVARRAEQKKNIKVIWNHFSIELRVILVAKNSVMRGNVITVLIILSGLLGCSVKPSTTETTQPQINELPSMTITLLDGSRTDVKTLQSQTILIFFQPECDHCQRAAQAIRKNLDAFRSSELYFVTSQPLDQAGKFANDYMLSGHSNVHFALAPLEDVLNNFGPISTPSIYIYSADQRLIKSLTGELKIEELLKYI
jgi:thioredoxin-related protein